MPARAASDESEPPDAFEEELSGTKVQDINGFLEYGRQKAEHNEGHTHLNDIFALGPEPERQCLVVYGLFLFHGGGIYLIFHIT